jgi:hypothetical protein
MLLPGEILARHKWIVLFAVFIVIAGVVAGANNDMYEYYKNNGPNITWENVPESAFILFLWNFANALTSLLIFPLLLLFVFRVFIVPGGFGLGVSLGIGLWLVSQNPLNSMVFSHGILEMYSAFLAMVGGFLILVKIGEAVWGFFKLAPHYVDWNKVAKEYGSLFLFSVIGLFISAWMEALLGYAIIHFGSSVWLVVIINTVISLLVVSSLSLNTVRIFITRKVRPTVTSTGRWKGENLETEKLPEGVWCICPKCGTYISADIEYCPCGTKLPKKFGLKRKILKRLFH